MLSTVIPVYNEAESLEQLFAELCEVATTHGYELDVIFVDDGSTDGSWAKIVELAGRDSRVRGIRFRRNFGKAAALNAGFAAVRGEHAMTLDADLQDDPHEIPNFLAKINSGLDVVSGWKQTRHDPWHKVLPSRVFNGMVSWLTGVKLHDHNCGMKCYRREVLGEVHMYGELHRFVPVLAAARGFKIGEHVVQHRARKFGHSKFGVERLIKGFLDLLTVKFLTTYGRRPMHPLGTIAAIAAVWGVGQYGCRALVEVLWTSGRTPLISSADEQLTSAVYLASSSTSDLVTLYFWLVVSLLFFLTGLLAELIVATRGPNRDIFSIAETVGHTSDRSTS
ncbi:MAG: glycosyltransferase family 2 protein [Planctomycetaceae bacterium]|nr:glycosyltransferase family 2 protein [Planctomycetaceae bacterium]